jgi:PPOX class probable F420-dependent enzyme
MEEMTHKEYKAFLLQNHRTGKVATVRKDGSPHVVPIWFDLDGDELVFTTYHTSVKAANLERNPRVSICVDDEAPPFAFVQINGVAKIDKQAEDLQYWTTRIAGRYMGPELAEEFGQRNAVEGEWLIRVTPTKVIAQKDLAD